MTWPNQHNQTWGQDLWWCYGKLNYRQPQTQLNSHKLKIKIFNHLVSKYQATTVLFSFFLFFFFNWSVLNLQYCLSFRCMAKWFSYTIFFRYFSLIGYNKILSWYYIYIYKIVCLCQSQAPNLSLPLHFPFGNHKSVFYVLSF